MMSASFLLDEFLELELEFGGIPDFGIARIHMNFREIARLKFRDSFTNIG